MSSEDKRELKAQPVKDAGHKSNSTLESTQRQAHTQTRTSPKKGRRISQRSQAELLDQVTTALGFTLSERDKSVFHKRSTGGKMAINNSSRKKRSPDTNGSTSKGGKASDTELGFAVESEIIPTLLQMLASETIATASTSKATGALPPIKKATNTSPLNTNSPSSPPPTWIESLSASAKPRARQLRPSEQLREDPAAIANKSINEAPTHSAGALAYGPNWVTPQKFATMVLDDREELALDHFTRLRNDGVADETLLLELLAPTSIELGRRWEEDLSDFTEVTVGVCRLHQVLRSMHPQHNRTLDGGAHGGRVVLTPAPGDQHSFGILLVGELLFRAGWYVDIDIDNHGAEPHLLSTVAKNWYEMVGISLGCAAKIQNTTQLISDVRRHSCNPNVKIIVGGQALITNPSIADSLGADQVITDGKEIAPVTDQYIPTQKRV